RAFGAIMDKKAGWRATPVFPKMLEQEDPSAVYRMTQSAPLMIPTRPNATLTAKGLNASYPWACERERHPRPQRRQRRGRTVLREPCWIKVHFLPDQRAVRFASADVEAALNPAAPATPDTPDSTQAGHAELRQGHYTRSDDAFLG